jgi:preprotein translocase subunit SecD
MKKNLQYRLILILAVIALSVFMYMTNGINLGLDLQGGVHLVLQVRSDEALAAEIDQARDRIESTFTDAGIAFTELRVVEDQIELVGVAQVDQDAAERELENSVSTISWNHRPRFDQGNVDYSISMIPAARKDLMDRTIRGVRDIIENRIDQYGVAEPTITVYGSGEVKDQIIVELPGVEDFDRVLQLMVDVAKLELKLVHPSYPPPFDTREAALRAFNNQIPAEWQILPYRDRDETGGLTLYMVVRRAAAVTGQHLKNARRSEDPFSGRSEVVFWLNTEGSRLFSDVTGKNVNGFLAVVLDDEVRLAPRIENQIDTESARITGNYTPQQADDLALMLRSGALPASIGVLENRSVGPSLGLDSIRSGISASILGMILVVIAMLVVYKLSGINAIICLVLNLLILVGCLAYFGATLTLPGIAGVILTIGMAVDANILIFERIKEELRLGKAVRSAVESGFGRVFSTIIDTNITTLVAALFLFQFGTGPVRGFAVTLAVGLLANIFTATFVSRTIFSTFLQRREVKSLSI